MKKTKNKLMISVLLWMLLLQIILPFGLSAKVYADEMPEEETEIVEEPDEFIEEQENTSTETVESKNVSENTAEITEEKIPTPPTPSESETETSESKEIEHDEKSTETTSEEQESVEGIETEESEETSQENTDQPTTLTFETEELKVEVSGEPGVIPEGTKLVVEPVSDEDTEIYLEAIEQKNDTPINSAALFDITLLDEEGNEIQPNGEVTVKFYGLDHITEADEVFVNHVEMIDKPNMMRSTKKSTTEKNVNIEAFKPTVEAEKLSFNTDHFSIYIVGSNVSHEDETNRFEMYVGETIKLEEKHDEFWVPLVDAWDIESQGGELEILKKDDEKIIIRATHEGKVTVRYRTDKDWPWGPVYNRFYIDIIPNNLKSGKFNAAGTNAKFTDINGNDGTQNKEAIDNPELPVVSGSINRVYALVDSEGNYIKQSDGSNTYIPIEPDLQTYKQPFLINGNHLLDIDQEYNVTADVPNGYVLFSQEHDMKEQELTYENRETATVEFKVTNNSASGGLEIAFEGQELEKDSNGYIIPNYPQGELPQTGGIGILGFMVVGITIMLSSLIYYKKKDNGSFKNNGGNNNE